MKLPAAIALLYVSAVAGFATPGSSKPETALHMTPPLAVLKKASVSAVAAAFLASNLAIAEPAQALDMDFGTSQVVAGRSGGRAGGRSTAARAPVRPTTSSSSTTHVIHRTTYVQPAPVIVAPPVYSYGYNPLPGLGLSIGLNTMNQIGNDIRDYRQESEIAQTRAQLQDARQREADMEARLRQLEMANQNNLLNQQQQQQLMQLELMMQQQKAAAAPAAN